MPKRKWPLECSVNGCARSSRMRGKCRTHYAAERRSPGFVAVSNVKHGHTVGRKRTPTYSSWHSMLERCGNPKNTHYNRYGGRGITVCARWLKFENFLADMGERPQATTLDRINANGNYEPSNCRWATKHQQANNTNRNSLIEYQGERLTIAEWANRINIPATALRSRIVRYGWSTEDALTTPLLPRGHGHEAYDYSVLRTPREPQIDESELQQAMRDTQSLQPMEIEK